MKHIALAVALVGLAAGGSSAATSDTGIAGRVFVEPACPGPEPVEGCRRPAAVPVSVLRADQLVARVRSRSDGRFRFQLRPGAYVVRARTEGRPLRVAQKRVVVPRTGYARVTLTIDLGIR